MKSRRLIRIIAMTLLAVAMPVSLAAQNTRYKLIDLGTFGGPNGFVNGPGVRDLSNSGIYAGEAETATPDPYAPYCQNGDCFVQHGQKWRNGVVTDLGTLGVNLSGGATWISANGRFISGVSDNGVPDPLLGYTTENRAVLWTDNGAIADLGTLPGGTESFSFSVNNKGMVVGIANNAVPDPFSPPFSFLGWGTQTRAFLWQDGVMQDLGTLGGPDALPFEVNERGQIMGYSYTDSIPNATTGLPTIDPFLWENGTMIDLGTLGGTLGFPSYMNNRGQVAGVSNLAGDANTHPFLWDRGVLTDIGTFGGSNGETDRISDSGDVVGRADLPGDFIHHAFVWKNGVMTDLGVVPGDSCTNGRAVNSRGQAIGTSTNCMGVTQHIFLWENGSIFDLGALILGGTDIAFQEALDINDRGEIAVVGVLPNGDQHAVLLLPASEKEIAEAGVSSVAKAVPDAHRRVATTSCDSAFGGRARRQYALRSLQP